MSTSEFLTKVESQLQSRSRGSVDLGSFFAVIHKVLEDGALNADDVDTIVNGLEAIYDRWVDFPYVPEMVERKVIDPVLKPLIRDAVVRFIDVVGS